LGEAVGVESGDVKERAAFLEKFVASETAARASRAPVQSVPEMSVSQKFPSEVLHKAETTLAHYIGAIAKVVVRRAAVKARDEAELYLLIADEIKDPVERKNFIRKAVSVSRPRSWLLSRGSRSGAPRTPGNARGEGYRIAYSFLPCAGRCCPDFETDPARGRLLPETFGGLIVSAATFGGSMDKASCSSSSR